MLEGEKVADTLAGVGRAGERADLQLACEIRRVAQQQAENLTARIARGPRDRYFDNLAL